MSWAARQRLRIVLIIGVVVLAVISLALYLSLHQAPSCVDGVQNENEAGIDCGGPCPYLCVESEQAPVVRFTQVFPGLASTTDVLAYVDNPNRDAYAKGVFYTLSFYSASSTALGSSSGTLDLAPGMTTPVFVANIPGGVTRAYLTLDAASTHWQAGTNALVPSVASPAVSGTTDAPRITATLTNPYATPLSNIVVIAALFDSQGNVITASRTLIPELAGQGSAQAAFAWPAAFAEAPVRIDVLPEPALP